MDSFESNTSQHQDHERSGRPTARERVEAEIQSTTERPRGQLTQLKQAGALDGLAGIALGLFSGLDDYEDRGWTLKDVLRDQLVPLGVPVLGGLKIGHNGNGIDGGPDQVCVAIGAVATIDTTAGTLTTRSPSSSPSPAPVRTRTSSRSCAS